MANILKMCIRDRIRGIIKREEGAIGIDDGTVRDIALISKVGKSICFNIIEMCIRDSIRRVCAYNFVCRKNTVIAYKNTLLIFQQRGLNA